MKRLHLLGALGPLLGLHFAACAGGTAPQLPAATAAPASACLPAGDGFLNAQLRGAIDADVHWSNDDMSCDGGSRPDGRGIRATFAGTLPPSVEGAAPRHLRLIFGIDLEDTAPGAAQALPTNLTVIIEGEQTLFSTQGDTRCAVESLERRPLLTAGNGIERIQVSGYCVSPATDIDGQQRLLIPTFEFAGRVAMETTP